jgi:hypothetical protein
MSSKQKTDLETWIQVHGTPHQVVVMHTRRLDAPYPYQRGTIAELGVSDRAG